MRTDAQNTVFTVAVNLISSNSTICYVIFNWLKNKSVLSIIMDDVFVYVRITRDTYDALSISVQAVSLDLWTCTSTKQNACYGILTDNVITDDNLTQLSIKS